jgi:hypothetical protein
VREELRSAGPQFQVPVAGEKDAAKPKSKLHKGRSFEALFMCDDEASFEYPDIVAQFGHVMDGWCLKHGVEQGCHQFHMIDSTGNAEVVDTHCHLFDYADIHRQVFVTACRIEDLHHQGVDASHNTESGPPLQLEQPHSGLPLNFANWLYARLREEKPDDADSLFDCVWAFLADAAVEDWIEQLNEASNLLKESGAPTIADELAAQWYASVG